MDNLITILGVAGWVVTVLGVAFTLPYFLNSRADSSKSSNKNTSSHEKGLDSN
jgi:hypothetical protein